MSETEDPMERELRLRFRSAEAALNDAERVFKEARKALRDHLEKKRRATR